MSMKAHEPRKRHGGHKGQVRTGSDRRRQTGGSVIELMLMLVVSLAIISVFADFNEQTKARADAATVAQDIRLLKGRIQQAYVNYDAVNAYSDIQALAYAVAPLSLVGANPTDLRTSIGGTIEVTGNLVLPGASSIATSLFAIEVMTDSRLCADIVVDAAIDFAAVKVSENLHLNGVIVKNAFNAMNKVDRVLLSQTCPDPDTSAQASLVFYARAGT